MTYHLSTQPIRAIARFGLGSAFAIAATVPMVGPASAQMAMTTADPGEVSATMSMNGGGMSMRAATGGRAVSFNFGNAGGDRGSVPGPTGPGRPSPADPASDTGRRAPGFAGVVAVAGDGDYNRCLEQLRRVPEAERPRMARRCQRMR